MNEVRGRLSVRLLVSIDADGVYLRGISEVDGVRSDARPLRIPSRSGKPMAHTSDEVDAEIDLSVADVIDHGVSSRGAERVRDAAIAKGMQVLNADAGYVDLPLPKDIRVVWDGPYGYSINLDERGEFRADVRDALGQSVYEIEGFDLFEDGFMKNKHDLGGLAAMLVEHEVIPAGNDLLPLVEAERCWESYRESEYERNHGAAPRAG